MQWDESIDGSPEGPACGGMIQLPSPRLINTSPLNRYEIKNLKKRRKGRKWSLLEEDTLRSGVEKYVLSLNLFVIVIYSINVLMLFLGFAFG